jgi:hypothetical protein
MPANIQIGVFVLGAILLILALTGGDFEFGGAKIGKGISPRSRIVSGILSVILIALGIIDPTSLIKRESQTVSTAVEAANTTVTNIPTSLTLNSAIPGLSPTTASSASVTVTSEPLTVVPEPTAVPLPTSAPQPTSTAQPTEITTVVAPTLARTNVIEVNQTQESNIEGVSLIVDSVEFRANGNMRWNLIIWNQTQESGRFGLTLPSTYLADENGVRYDVTADLGGRYPGNIYYLETAPAGIKSKYWLEFSTPKNGAKTFKVVLIPELGNTRYKFQSFIVTLEYDTVLFPTPAHTGVPNGYTVLTLDLPLESNLENFENRLESVVLLPGDKMRWNFTFWNKSGQARRFGLTLSQTYLADENGNKYDVVADKGGRYPGNIYYLAWVEDGVKFNYWLEFPAPKDGAKNFKATLVRELGNTHLVFQPFGVTLP